MKAKRFEILVIGDHQAELIIKKIIKLIDEQPFKDKIRRMHWQEVEYFRYEKNT